MKVFDKLFRLRTSINIKLLFLNLTVFIVFGIISGMVVYAFRNIETMTAKAIERDVRGIIHNTRLGKELFGAVERTHLLLSSFYKNEKVLETEGSLLKDNLLYLNSGPGLSDQPDDKYLKKCLGDFHEKLDALLRQCALINTVFREIEAVAAQTQACFAELEDKLAREGSHGGLPLRAVPWQDDISDLEQFGKLIPSYRQIFLHTDLHFSTLEPLRTHTGDAEAIVLILDDLSRKILVLLLSDPEIAAFGEKLWDNISKYKSAVVTFNEARNEFRKCFAELSDAKERTVAAKSRCDENRMREIERMLAETSKKIKTSTRFVYILSGAACFLFAVFSFLFFQTNIRKPIESICGVLEAIGDGDMDVRIRLGRTDEWLMIEMALNKMVSEVWNSYSELYRKNEAMHRIHQELRMTQGYIKNIIDSMPSVVIGVDPDGRITHWNMAASAAAGISEGEDIRGRLLTDVYPDMSAYTAAIRKSLEDREPVKTEKQPRHRSEEIYYEDIMIYPLVANGVEGAVIRIDDVTSRVRIEEMMIQTEKMMSVGGLAAGMAHEINNPLGIILQGVQNAIRRISPDLEANHEAALSCGVSLEAIRLYMEKRGIVRYLNGIKDAGSRAADIVSNMLNFSRRSESAMIRTDINKLLDNTVLLAASDYDLKKKYDFRHIEIVRDYEPDPVQVPCIDTEIEQVILNLLKNSAQAMAEVKEKTEKPRIILRTRKEPEHLRIEVQDNGPGIDEKIRTRIFEPFFTTKTVGIGTGLGLSVSFFIITNNHKGRIFVESELGKGAKFVIQLPVKR